MQLGTLHYIYDPLCGWCYGAAPLLKAAAEVPGLQIHLHAGGMMAGPRRHSATPQLREFVRQHADRITRMTGQPFGAAYLDGLLANPDVILDSEPPTTAILVAAEQGRDQEMLARLQQVHFVEGRHLGDREVLQSVAAELGLDDFDTRYEALLATTAQHIQNSRDLLASVGGSGFPTWARETPNGLTMLNSPAYLGKPEEWAAALATLS